MEAVVVVVNLGGRLARKSARHPADVLHDSAAARDQKGQEQAVEGGKIEAFAEVGAGGEQQDRGVARPDPVEDRPVQLLARPAFQHGGFETMARAQLGSEGLEVHGPVREHEDAAPPSVRVGDVAPDLPGSILITGHLSEDRLHWGVFGRVRVGQGLMHDKVPPDEHRCRGILDHGVTDGSELHVEDPPRGRRAAWYPLRWRTQARCTLGSVCWSRRCLGSSRPKPLVLLRETGDLRHRGH